MKVKPGQEENYEIFVKINQNNPYSNVALSFAVRWTDLMEPLIDKGEDMEDIMKKTIGEADTDGITGFMYNCATNILKRFWVYGDKLKNK